MKKGFTFVELLVVIAIIGLIASVASLFIVGQTQRARIARALQFGVQIYRAIGVDAVGVWDFDEGSGTTAIDGSGSGNNGTINGATYNCSDTPHHAVGEGDGKCALSFDGTDDYVGIPNSTGLNIGDATTLEAWVKNDELKNSFILGKGQHDPLGDGAYFLKFEGGNIYISIIDSSDTRYDAITTGTTGVWYHVVGTYDQNRIKIYVNGELKRDNPAGGQPIRSSTYGVDIGKTSGSLGFYFHGIIDGVRIYSRALSVGEVEKLYVDGLPHHQVAME